ncbi:MAG: hypothetical protein GWP17_02070 [Aquificales bacterium]|nr:hypothetical protein [Aquificales bacterium]
MTETETKTPRIGVFVCHCGHNIAGVVDVAQHQVAFGEYMHRKTKLSDGFKRSLG